MTSLSLLLAFPFHLHAMRKMKVFNLQLHSPCNCLLNSIDIYGDSTFPAFSLWKEVRAIWKKFLRVNTVL